MNTQCRKRGEKGCKKRGRQADGKWTNTENVHKKAKNPEEKLKIVSVIELYVEVIKYSFKIHNILLSEKALVRFIIN